VLPLLARHRGRGGRSTVIAAHEPVAGPFAAAAVAELLPARTLDAPGVIEASVVDAEAAGGTELEDVAGPGRTGRDAGPVAARNVAREGRRAHSRRARRRGAGR